MASRMIGSLRKDVGMPDIETAKSIGIAEASCAPVCSG